MTEVVLSPPSPGRVIRRAAGCLLVGSMALGAAPVHAQVQMDTVAMRAGSVGIHALVGAMGGRIDMQGGPVTELLGARAGLGFGEILELTGFYWRGVDRDERELRAGHIFGGEARLALNTGFGITPFLSGGVSRLELDDDDEARTAAIAGAGLSLPLGPVLLSATAHDYILGITGLDRDGVADVTHNWMLGVGVTIGVGRGRSAEPIVVARPAPAAPVAAAPPAAPAPAPAAPATDPAVPTAIRNYQSTRTIEVPIPLEGTITLHYGPDRSAAAAAAARAEDAPDVAISGLPPARAARATAGIMQDPLLQAWLRQAVSQELALQLRGLPVAGAAPAAPQPGAPQQQLLVPQQFAPGEWTAAGMQRALDNAVATMLVRIEAGEAQRMNVLRQDLRQALTAQYDHFQREIARIEGRPPGPPVAVAPGAPALAPQPVPGAPPAAVPPAAVPAPVAPPAAAAEPAAGEVAAAARAAAARMDAEIRLALADIAGLHPQLLGTAETTRGPAVVLGDVAFVPGASLVGEVARPALRRVAEMLLSQPDRVVYVHGHTDADGPELQNQRLSELRAETVRSLLVQEGLDPDRVIAIGFGEGRPVADNVTPAGRAMNRRVEIVIGDARAGLEARSALDAWTSWQRMAMEDRSR